MKNKLKANLNKMFIKVLKVKWLPMFFSIFGLTVLLLACTSAYQLNVEEQQIPVSQEFSDYWFQGKAELTSYELNQARYGEVHKGHAVLIFVTEDFSFSKQVKLDYPEENKSDALKVMKLNLTKKFNTGIYPYSIMQSVFTPLNTDKFPYSLKLNASSQEWCGHTYSNMNLLWDGYRYFGHSYFESEVYAEDKLKRTISEDEIWNRIKIDYKRLPVGEFDIIPSLMYSRLRHSGLKIEKATGTLTELTGQTSQLQYTLKYADIPRSLSIIFEKDFPNEIISWEERQPSGFGPGAKEMVTTGKRIKKIMLDYWTKNNVADSTYRAMLGLQ